MSPGTQIGSGNGSPLHKNKGLFPRLWRQWALACSLGEFLGIAGAAAIAVGHRLLLGEPVTTEDKLLNLFLMCLAGGIEGTILATFQWRVLSQVFQQVGRRQWWAYTVAAAILGWLLGMMPSLFINDGGEAGAGMAELSGWAFFGMAGLLGLFLGALFGYFQWLPLKPWSRRSIEWIPANALGWAAGMIFIFLGASLPDEQTHWALIVVSGALGGILGGMAVGAVTGFFLLRLARTPT